MDRNVNIIVDLDGKKIVLINDIRFKGKNREDWKVVENYLTLKRCRLPIHLQFNID